MIDLDPGVAPLEAARARGLPVAASCVSEGICGRCVVRIEAGVLSAPDSQEQATLLRLGRAPNERLFCRLRPASEAIVVSTGYW